MSRQKRTTKLLIAVGLAAALLTTASVAFGTDGATSHSIYDNLGKLDLIMNDAQGDKFVFTPTTGSTTTQALNSVACRINPDSGSLVSLTANDDNKAGLKDHVIGVKAKTGEGSNGTPCSRINNSFDTNPSMAEILTIEFTNTLSNYQADYAQLGLKLKFGATARIDVYSGAAFVQSFDIPCPGANDCGADSGDDRVLAKIDPAGNARFNRVVIKVFSPSDGSVSLIDDPGFDTYFDLAGDVTAPTINLVGPNPLILVVGDSFTDPGAEVVDIFDGTTTISGQSDVPVSDGIVTTSGRFSITYNASDSSGNAADEVVRTVIVYDGTLLCGETRSIGGASTMAGTFKRLSNRDLSDCTAKPYNLSVSAGDGTLTFDPDDNAVPQLAAYSATISAPPKASANPTAAFLEYDPFITGSLNDLDNMEWCVAAEFDNDGFVTTAELPGSETWCIAAENTVIVGPNEIRTTWTVYGHDDPIFRGN